MRRRWALLSLLACALAAVAGLLLPALPAAAVSTATFSLSPTGPNSTALIVEPGVGPETVKFALQNRTGKPITIALGIISAIKGPDASTPYNYVAATGFGKELHLPSRMIRLTPHETELVPVTVDRPRKNTKEAYALVTAEQVTKKATSGVTAVAQLQLFVVLKTGDPLAPAGSGNGAGALLIIIASALIALVVVMLIYLLRKRRRGDAPPATPAAT